MTGRNPEQLELNGIRKPLVNMIELPPEIFEYSDEVRDLMGRMGVDVYAPENKLPRQSPFPREKQAFIFAVSGVLEFEPDDSCVLPPETQGWIEGYAARLREYQEPYSFRKLFYYEDIGSPFSTENNRDEDLGAFDGHLHINYGESLPDINLPNVEEQ